MVRRGSGQAVFFIVAVQNKSNREALSVQGPLNKYTWIVWSNLGALKSSLESGKEVR
jgi:hypothetical protein